MSEFDLIQSHKDLMKFMMTIFGHKVSVHKEMYAVFKNGDKEMICLDDEGVYPGVFVQRGGQTFKVVDVRFVGQWAVCALFECL